MFSILLFAQVVFLPSSLYVSLLFEGIIWFLLPTALVIVNDIMAYLAGAQWLCRLELRAGIAATPW